MRWTLSRIAGAGPTFEPVTLDQLKAHLRGVSSTALDSNLSSLIVSAREWAEDHTGRSLVDQQWLLTIGSFLGSAAVPAGAYSGDYRESATGELMLRRSPALSIVSVTSVGADGAETIEDADSYAIRDASSKWPRLYPLSGASFGSGELRIVFRAGYADTTSSPADDATVIPQCFNQAIMLHAEAHYDRNPESMKILLDAAKALIQGERCSLGMA